MRARGRTPLWIPALVLSSALSLVAVAAYFAVEGGASSVMALAFGVTGLIGTVVAVWLLLRWHRRAAADKRLIASGRVGAATVTSVELTGRTIESDDVVKAVGYRLELDPADGGGPLRVSVLLPPGLRAGTQMRVAYDPVTRDTAILETPRAENLSAPS